MDDVGHAVLSHPFNYVRFLVQVGHEPLPPTPSWTLFGRREYRLPGLFAYARHIVKVDGAAGLFTGLLPRLCALKVGNFVYDRVLEKCHEEDVKVTGDQRPDEGTLLHVVNETTKEMIARSCAMVLAHPFHVIMLRRMAQFIGRETKYSSLFGSILTIYREEGIMGFFTGLIPRLLGGAASLWLLKLLAHSISTPAINYSMTHTHEINTASHIVASYFSDMLVYPFNMVSNVMAVNNCGLAAGVPPYALAYPSWIHCWGHLKREGNMARGKNLFFRGLPAGKSYDSGQRKLVLRPE